MARKKPARPTTKKPAKKAKTAKTAKKKASPRAAVRKAVKKTAQKAPRKAARPKKAARKTAKKAAKKATRKAKPVARNVVRKVVKKAAAARKAPARKPAPVAKKAVAARKAVPATAATPIAAARKPNLDRPRKTVADIHGIPSSLGMASLASAAHSGLEELRDTLRKNNSASPALTAGDVDANWQSAESHGDESPGGDNPTPDQDVVEEIGRALGVEYADDEELQGGAEIAERDVHRWELDPNSKDDFEDEE